jgi:hypothetical protein
MRSSLLVASIGCLLVVAGNQSGCPEEGPAKPGPGTAAAQSASTQPAGTSNFIVGSPVRHKNLTIFPVLSKTAQNSDRFITLDEGLRAHTVEIIEMGASRSVAGNAPVNPAASGEDAVNQRTAAQSRPNARIRNRQRNSETINQQRTFADRDSIQANEVNRLVVVNKSGKPLYLMPGEVIVGGDQDRTIGEELTVAPTGKPVPIDVYCVEHGRWGNRGLAETGVLLREISAAQTPAVARPLAAEAAKGKFVATPGPLSKKARKAVQFGEGQQAVWDRVQMQIDEADVKSDSGAFTANYSDKRVRDGIEPYLKGLSEQIAGQDRVVGALVAVNGKVESVDIFESTPLFRKLWPKLLKSYALDALNAVAAKDAGKSCEVAAASAFLAKVMQAPVSGTKQTKGGLVLTRRVTKEGVSYSASGSKAAGGMAGGMGGAIHSAGYAP